MEGITTTNYRWRSVPLTGCRIWTSSSRSTDPSCASFVRVTDALMAAELGAALPGWRDTIVARMGGLGFVYLVAYHGKLHQIDLYVVPVSRLCGHHHRVIHTGDWQVRLANDGHPEFVPPAWLDPTRTPRRNRYHRRP